MAGPLLMRADGSPRMGTGHIMRCLALAQEWRDRGGSVTVASIELTPLLEKRLEQEGIHVLHLPAETPGSEADARMLAEAASSQSASWLIVDGYQFSGSYQRQLRSAGFKVLAVDDNGHSGPPQCHLLLNPNLHARPALHPGAQADTEFLLGPRYAPLRREFSRIMTPDPTARAQPPRRILLSLGGADPHNLTLEVLRLMEPLISPGLHVDIIVGGSNPHFPSIESWTRGKSGMEPARDVADMAAHLGLADLAIIPASSTCLEAFRFGLPCLMIAFADNQQQVAAYSRENKLAQVLDATHPFPGESFLEQLRTLLDDPLLRVSLARAGAGRVDGQGARRIIQAMDLYGTRLVPVTSEDARQLWDWANDAEVRRRSFHSHAIPWETHMQWLRERLAEPHSRFFIARTPEGEGIGQIRLESNGNGTATVHLSTSPPWRGRGAGARMLRLVDSVGFSRLLATVKMDNPASARIFENAGYRRMDENQGAWQFQRDLPLS